MGAWPGGSLPIVRRIVVGAHVCTCLFIFAYCILVLATRALVFLFMSACLVCLSVCAPCMFVVTLFVRVCASFLFCVCVCVFVVFISVICLCVCVCCGCSVVSLFECGLIVQLFIWLLVCLVLCQFVSKCSSFPRVHLHIYIYMCLCVYTYIYICVCFVVCSPTCLFVCLCLCMSVPSGDSRSLRLIGRTPGRDEQFQYLLICV